MGFGLIFIGYATLLLFRIVPIELVGFFLIYMGLDKLEAHEQLFKYAKYASVYMFLESVLSSFMWIARFTGMEIPYIMTDSFAAIENILYHCGLLILTVLLMRGICRLAKSVGYEKGAKRATFAIAATLVFYLAELCVALIPKASAFMALPLMLFQLLWLCVNLFVIFGCYMMIVNDEILEKEEQKYSEYLAKNGRKNKNADIKNTNKLNKKSNQKIFKASKK